MSDEKTRSTPGRAPQPRRPSDAPTWWADLDRDDLPSDGAALAQPATPTPRAQAMRLVQPTPLVRRLTVTEREPLVVESSGWLRTLLSVLAVTAVVVLCGWVGIGGDSLRGLLIASLLFGVPTAVVVATVSVASRRLR